MNVRRVAAAVIAGLFAAPAHALAPDQVFDKVSPSVWAVRGLDASERPFSYGSGVVIGPERMITNCHVLAKAKAVQVRRENVSYEAKLEHADAERDLCTLTIKGFTAPAVRIRGMVDLKVGQRVYAVGNPERLTLTLSEGLISGLRSEDPQLPPIQTSAPISQGSSGGGLFDSEGQLVGITTLILVGRARIAQNLNFAMPAEWILEVPERAKALLAARKSAPAASASATGDPASPGLPAAGATYRYQWSDRQYARKVQEFTVQISSVNGWNINESFGTGGATTAAQVSAREPTFVGRKLADGQTLQEFAPYLPMPEHDALPPLGQISSYSGSGGWNISAESRGWEQVTVPSGTYRALRVELRGVRPTGPVFLGGGALIEAVQFDYTAWYAPDVRRYVRVRHQTWNARSSSISDENIELLEYRPN
jgi:serine protease Do